MRKDDRQLLIKQLVLDHDISTQEELIGYLEDAGVKATQATISRDIKELNLVKTPVGKDKTIYTLYQTNQSSQYRLDQTIGDTVQKVTVVEFLTVINTLPGNADVLAALFDQLYFPDIVATIAGYDTLVVITKGNEKAELIADYVKERMEK